MSVEVEFIGTDIAVEFTDTVVAPELTGDQITVEFLDSPTTVEFAVTDITFETTTTTTEVTVDSTDVTVEFPHYTRVEVTGSGVPDDEWTLISDCTPIVLDFFTGSPLSVGTNGYLIGRWRRHGRDITFKFGGVWDTDHDDGFVIFDFTEIGLPAPLRAANLPSDQLAFSSDFCYIAVPNTAGAPPFNGILEPFGAAIISTPFSTDYGFGALIQMSRYDQSDGAIGNVWDTAGGGTLGFIPAGTITADMTGRSFQLIASFTYEAADPA